MITVTALTKTFRVTKRRASWWGSWGQTARANLPRSKNCAEVGFAGADLRSSVVSARVIACAIDQCASQRLKPPRGGFTQRNCWRLPIDLEKWARFDLRLQRRRRILVFS
jgi:hypothetical protein